MNKTFSLVVVVIGLICLNSLGATSESCGQCNCLRQCKYESKLCKLDAEANFDCVESYHIERKCLEVFRNCSDACLAPPPRQGSCCYEAGLPRSAQEYFTLNKEKAVNGKQVSICIDQGGDTCYYPINVVAGVYPNGTILDYLLVNNETNYATAGCVSNCNSGGGAACSGYNYPSGHPEITFNWSAVRFDPISLLVYVRDENFTTSTGCFTTWGNPWQPYSWGATWNCDGGGSWASSFMIDLTGTPFTFNTTSSAWITEGASPRFTFKTNTNLTKSVTGWGYCAQIQPAVNIQLSFASNAPTYKQ